MRAPDVHALAAIDSAANTPDEFVLAVTDSRGKLLQASGCSPEVAGFLVEFVSELLLARDAQGGWHLPDPSGPPEVLTAAQNQSAASAPGVMSPGRIFEQGIIRE